MEYKIYYKFLLLIFLHLLSFSGFAYGESPVGGGLEWIKDELFGSTGITISVLGLAGMGVMCVYGFLEWVRLIQAAAGIAILFGSEAIVTAIKSAAGG